jgi:hypothetical protein
MTQATKIKGEKTELEKLREWVEIEKQNGLNDVKFYPADLSDASLESFAKDVNLLLNGKEVPITDID